MDFLDKFKWTEIYPLTENTYVGESLIAKSPFMRSLQIESMNIPGLSNGNIYIFSTGSWSVRTMMEDQTIENISDKYNSICGIDGLRGFKRGNMSRYGSMRVADSTGRYSTSYIENLLILKNGGKNSMKTREILKSTVMPSRVLAAVNTVMTRAQDAAIGYLSNAVKSALGKEYSFVENRDAKLIENITNKFIKKYDKKFEHHASLNSNNEGRLYNQMFITRLSKNTFMYVATGNKLGKIEDRYFTYNNIDDSDMYIYIFGPEYKKFETEIENIIKRINNNRALGIYMIDARGGRYGDEDGESLHVLYSPMEPRNIETLFFSNNEAEDVCNHIDRFNSNKDFYKQRQILYKTGILLYGAPGTGKSSFVKALATKYGRSIVTINVSNLKHIDLNSLSQAINVDDKKSYIVLFEDIDTLFLNRDATVTDKEDNSVVNKLLQFLDSNTSPTNVIFIATTNHIERLDAALLREGRFDLKVEVKALARPEAFQFGRSFNLDDNTIDEILDIIDNETEFKIVHMYNQSKLQARFLSKIENKSYEDSVKLHCEEEIPIEPIEDVVVKTTKKKTSKKKKTE